MDWEWLGKTLVAGSIVIAILKIIFTFMLKYKDKKNGNNNNKVQAGGFVNPQVIQWIKQLYEWHEPDNSGIQQWKNPSFAEDIKSIESEIKNQTALITKICVAVESGSRQINEMHTKLMKE